MSNCINNCKLCNNLVISRSVTFANNQLTIDLPSGNYLNNGRYCIVIAQTIPTTVTIATPVVFTINGGTTVFDFLNKDCTPIYASQLRTRRIYPTRVSTAVGTGVFKYIGKNCLPCTSVTPATLLTTATV